MRHGAGEFLPRHVHAAGFATIVLSGGYLEAGDTAVRENPALNLSEWARGQGLSPGSVSRGFGLAYGVTPASYRLWQRTHCAVRAILGSDAPLTTIAQSCGFADQAHMTRAVRRATALSPGALRRSVATGGS